MPAVINNSCSSPSLVLLSTDSILERTEEQTELSLDSTSLVCSFSTRDIWPELLRRSSSTDLRLRSGGAWRGVRRAVRELVFLSSSGSGSLRPLGLTTTAATLSELLLANTGASTLLASGAVAGGEGC